LFPIDTQKYIKYSVHYVLIKKFVIIIIKCVKIGNTKKCNNYVGNIKKYSTEEKRIVLQIYIFKMLVDIKFNYVPNYLFQN